MCWTLQATTDSSVEKFCATVVTERTQHAMQSKASMPRCMTYHLCHDQGMTRAAVTLAALLAKTVWKTERSERTRCPLDNRDVALCKGVLILFTGWQQRHDYLAEGPMPLEGSPSDSWGRNAAAANNQVCSFPGRKQLESAVCSSVQRLFRKPVYRYFIGINDACLAEQLNCSAQLKF